MHAHKTTSPRLKWLHALAAGLLALATVSRCAALTPDWLPVRDQNPFVLAAGLPLPPAAPERTGTFDLQVAIAEGNTQLLSGTHDNSILFAAETRETRVALSYAFDDAWSARAALGDVWIGSGFLDAPIRHFHDLIGAPQGDRGRLHVRTPFIGVQQHGSVLYELDRAGDDVAPLLLDVTRIWSPSAQRDFGIALGAKIPLGSTRRLSDDGGSGVSLSAFGDIAITDTLQGGARVGVLHRDAVDLLAQLSRSDVAFGGAYLRAQVIGDWRAQVQYDVHGALYRDVPNFLRYAGVLSLGVTHPLGQRTQLVLGISEDVPIAHTQDVALELAVRTAWGGE